MLEWSADGTRAGLPTRAINDCRHADGRADYVDEAVQMRAWLAVGVTLFGVIVGAGAVAIHNHGVIADETGISG